MLRVRSGPGLDAPAAAASPRPAGAKRLLFHAILIAIAVAVPLLLGELALRLFLPQSHMMPRLVSSDSYGHALPRDTVMVEALSGAWSFRYTVNALGYRGPAIPPAPNPAGADVLVLGDSYSFGEGVNDGEEYPAVLGRLLAGRARVVNLGVPGYGLAQQIRWYHDLGRAYEPAIVILQFTNNDLWENVVHPVARFEDGHFVFEDSPLPLAWLKDLVGASPLQYSHLYNLLRQSAFEVLLAGEVPKGPADRSPDEPDLERLYVGLLGPFVHELRADGASVLFLPVNHELEGLSRVKAALRRLQEAQALELLPVEDWFAGMTDYGSPEGHIWGARAHRLIAERLAERLQDRLDALAEQET